jgi:two-component system, NarL family, sensor histidine kinase EvgS
MVHKMKGASKMVGATDIALACLNVEQAAKEENLHKVKIEIKELVSAIEQFETYLVKINDD